MSWEKRTNAAGAVIYVVRWRDSAGRSRSKTVSRQRDAVALDAEMRRKKQMGELIAHERGAVTLEEFWPIWLRDYAAVNVTPRTQRMYECFWRRHIGPALGRYELREITDERISQFVAGLRLAPATVRRLMGMLSGVFASAVRWRYVAANPCSAVRRPPVESRRGRALTPEQLNALCLELSFRSASIVRVLAWTGLRPGELRALRWDDLSPALIRVERAASNDVVGPTKTRRQRSVELTDEARAALREWYMASGRPADGGLIFPGRDGGLWLDGAYSRWGQKAFKPAAARAGLGRVIPYDLRHTFASRLIAEGRLVMEVARQMGHTPEETLKTYAHEFEDAKSVSSACHAKLSLDEILSVRGA